MRKYRYIDVPVLVLGNNQTFGIIDFFQNRGFQKRTHSFTAVCGENTYLYEIAQDNLEKKLVVYTEIKRFLKRICKKRLKKIKSYIESYKKTQLKFRDKLYVNHQPVAILREDEDDLPTVRDMMDQENY